MRNLIMLITTLALGGLLLAACGGAPSGQPAPGGTPAGQPAAEPTGDAQSQLTAQPGAAEDTLVGTSWLLTEINGAAPVGEQTPTLEFVEPGRVAGTGGCNRYFGGFSQDGTTVSFGQMGSTKMACPQDGVMEQEQAFLNLLSRITSFSLAGDTLTLTADDGATLVFTRA